MFSVEFDVRPKKYFSIVSVLREVRAEAKETFNNPAYNTALYNQIRVVRTFK
jgi:hypothetical protein